MTRKLIFPALAILTIALASMFAACNDDDDDDTSGDDTSATPSVCDQKDAVESAVADLADIDVLTEGTDALNENVAAVRTEVDSLKEIASQDVEEEVDALDTAVTDAEDILSGLDDATLNEKIDGVQEALTGVATASADLADALSNECD